MNKPHIETAREYATEIVLKGYSDVDKIPHIEWRTKLAALVLKEAGSDFMLEALIEKISQKAATQLNHLMTAMDDMSEDFRETRTFAEQDLLSTLMNGAVEFAKEQCNELLMSLVQEFYPPVPFNAFREYAVHAVGEI